MRNMRIGFNKSRAVSAKLGHCHLLEKIILLAACASGTVIAVADTNVTESLFAQASQAASASNLERGIDTLLFLNHMNYVVETMDSYQNSLVLEQEYKTICANNLNMNHIPDPDIKDQLILLLDAIHKLIRTEIEYTRAKEDIERDHINAKHDIWMRFACGALSSGMSGALAAKEAGPLVMGLGAGKAVLGEAVTAFTQFEQAKRQYQKKGRGALFDYVDDKKDTVHTVYKEMLKLQYKFGASSKESDGSVPDCNFVIPDQYRLSGTNAKILVEILKDENPEGVFKQLDFHRTHGAYAFFPTFWYYYSIVAYKTGHVDEALEGCKHFNEINRGLFRSDPMAAAIAMTETSIMIERKQIDPVRLEELLQIILKNDKEGSNSDWEYFCACIYSSVLNKPKEAYKILGAMIARLERQNSNKLVKYSDLFSDKEKEIKDKKDKEKCAARENFFAENPVPIDSDLVRARILLREIMASNKDPMTVDYLRDVCYKNTTSSLEKLYYVGLMKTDSLWKIVKEDVEKLSLRYHRTGKEGSFVLAIPMTWFILGDIEISADLYQGTNKVCSLTETKKSRYMLKGFGQGEYDVAAIKIPCSPSLLNGKDSIVIRLPHKSWPVQIMYMPDICYDIDNFKKNPEVVTFVPNKAVFMDEIRPLRYVETKEVKQKISEWPKDEGCERRVYDYAVDVPCQFGSIVSMGVTNKSYLITCTNSCPQHRTLEVKVLTFNHYGAKFCTLENEVQLEPNATATILLHWPDELKESIKPAYVAIESKEYRSKRDQLQDVQWRDYIPSFLKIKK